MRAAATGFDVVEADVASIRRALDAGELSSVELVNEYLRRIAFYDRSGIRLNSVPVLNPKMFEEAAAADERRARGKPLGPLDGIPYTAKDSYKVEGLTVAAGSPAFERLVASADAFTIGRLRAVGAVLIGLTNMPPMAAGGMQRGVYGRAESPYNPEYLTAAFGSGSSNGSGTATSASFAAFGLGEETWSSGRAPASNNSLVAYTPSRGVISMRGNWPLYAAMDVVVPHTRTVDDLLAVLEVIVADDPEPRGDFWRTQAWVEIPLASAVRPDDYRSLRDAGSLEGKRLGVPRMYINRDSGGREPIATRPSVVARWTVARRLLERLGANVVEVDFPVVSNYENDRPGAESMYRRGIVPPEFLEVEMWDLIIHSWNDFLDQNGDPQLRSLDDVDGRKVFPLPTGTLPDRYPDDADMAELIERARGLRDARLECVPFLPESLRGLEVTRKLDLEDWLDDLGLDAVVFPAAADVAPENAERDWHANDVAWRNGVRYSNGNLAIRHLGIPTVTVPMGLMDDIGMPVGLTFAGRAYSDSELLRYAYAFESIEPLRRPPVRTPAIGRGAPGRVGEASPDERLTLSTRSTRRGDKVDIEIVAAPGAPGSTLTVYVDGEAIGTEPRDAGVGALVTLPTDHYAAEHSEWRPPYGSIISVLEHRPDGTVAGAYDIEAGTG